jgi:hypothetical protein
VKTESPFLCAVFFHDDPVLTEAEISSDNFFPDESLPFVEPDCRLIFRRDGKPYGTGMPCLQRIGYCFQEGGSYPFSPLILPHSQPQDPGIGKIVLHTSANGIPDRLPVIRNGDKKRLVAYFTHLPDKNSRTVRLVKSGFFKGSHCNKILIPVGADVTPHGNLSGPEYALP